MDKYTVESTSKFSGRVVEPIVIEESDSTRKVLVVDLNDKKWAEKETVSISIVHQRKKQKDIWEDCESVRLSSLKAGDCLKLNLNSATTRKVYDALTNLYAIVSEKGVQYGTNELAVADADEIIQVSKDRKKVIEQLLQGNHGEEVWNELVNNDPDLATKLSLARVQADRLKALQMFKENLEKNNDDESFWQSFFSNNQWIFGYGLNYQFLNLITDQPHYGGTNYTGKGAQRGDYLMNSEAELKFTVLVEIKTPEAPLLSKDTKGNNREVRNDTWLLSSQLIGAVSQIQVNSKTWARKSQDKVNAKTLEAENIFTVQPRGILVIGNNAEFKKHEAKLSSFELFRRNMSNPEIITFDELYERAKFIVSNQDHDVTEIGGGDHLPF